jgi:hypothetical protein
MYYIGQLFFKRNLSLLPLRDRPIFPKVIDITHSYIMILFGRKTFLETLLLKHLNFKILFLSILACSASGKGLFFEGTDLIFLKFRILFNWLY